MPKYALADLQFLVQEDAYTLATEKCKRNVRGLGLTDEQAAGLVLQFQPHHFDRVYPYLCKNDFGKHHADEYLVWVDLATLSVTQPGQGVKLYVKLAVDANADGEACLLISFHRVKR
jgi:hypothetical protein